MNRKILYLFLLSFATICYAQDQSMREYIESVKKSATGKVAEVEPPAPYTGTDYVATDFRSPFRKISIRSDPDNVVSAEGGPKFVQQPRPDASRTRAYLERYRLDDFVMVGTLTKKGARWGLVEDNTGLVHALKIGDYIGPNSGKVSAIASDQIDVVETIPNGEGGWMNVKSFINMRTQE